MDKILVLRPILLKISDGRFFKTVFFWLFRSLACLNVLAILWSSWKLWGNLPSGGAVELFIGALLAQVILIAIGFVVFNILWLRAEDTQKLPRVKDYSVTPIVVIAIKALGEILASLSILFGIALSLTTFIAGPRIMNSLPFTFPLPGAGSPALTLVSGIISGFVLLACFYFIAETVGAVVDIARNTKKR